MSDPGAASQAPASVASDDPRFDLRRSEVFPSFQPDDIFYRSRLSPSARRFYEFFNSLQFLGSLLLLWYASQVLFSWSRCENCCCSASCSTGSSHCHFPNYDNTDDDLGDPTRALVNALFVVSLLQMVGGYLCACNIGYMRCSVTLCSAASLYFGFRWATQLTWLACHPLPNPVGNNDNWRGVAWHESSHGRNCVHILIAHACILASDCLLTGVLCIVSSASFNPREHAAIATEPNGMDGSKKKAE